MYNSGQGKAQQGAKLAVAEAKQLQTDETAEQQKVAEQKKQEELKQQEAQAAEQKKQEELKQQEAQAAEQKKQEELKQQEAQAAEQKKQEELKAQTSQARTQPAPSPAAATPAAPAPAAAPARAATVADTLKTVSSNSQLILVTSNGYGTSQATIQTFERDGQGQWRAVHHVSGYIGKYGFAQVMSEGGMKSPRGKYSIGTAFGRSGNPGTKLPFRAITPDDVWVDDSNSPLYNTWQKASQNNGRWNSAEKMDIPQYTYGFVINYNTDARTPGKGSAIFFHVSSGYTAGCTGTSQGNVVSILKWLDPAKNPVIIQSPTGELGSY